MVGSLSLVARRVDRIVDVEPVSTSPVMVVLLSRIGMRGRVSAVLGCMREEMKGIGGGSGL